MKKNIAIILLTITLIIFMIFFIYSKKHNHYIDDLNYNSNIEKKENIEKNINSDNTTQSNLKEIDNLDSIKNLIKKEQENVKNNIEKAKKEELINLENKKIEQLNLAKNALKKLYLPRTNKDNLLKKENLSHLKYIEIEFEHNNFSNYLITQEYKNYSKFTYELSANTDNLSSKIIHNDFPINSSLSSSNRLIISIDFYYNENRKLFDTLENIKSDKMILNMYLKDLESKYQNINKETNPKEYKESEVLKNSIVNLTRRIEELNITLLNNLKTDDLYFNQTLKFFVWDVSIKDKIEVPQEVFIWTPHSIKNFKCDLNQNDFVHDGSSYVVEYNCPELPILNDYDKNLKIYFN